jgi:PAS domain S-box-containing protein
MSRAEGLWRDPDTESQEVMKFKDGRLVLRRSVPFRMDGHTFGRVVTFRDISTVIATAEALEQNEAFLEKAQEVAHVGSFVVELDGTSQINWSAETHRIFGVPVGAFTGGSDAFYEFVPEDERESVRRAAMAALDTGEPYDIQHRIIRADGAVRWVHQRADIVRDASGRATRIVGTVQDITERRQLEEQLRQSQKMEALGRLAGGIAHDLNNALTAIVGYTELAIGELDDTHSAMADVQEIRRAAERAASVTGQLLAFSRKQMLERRVFDLNTAVSALGRMLERILGDDVQLETSVAPDLPPVFADPGQIEQAIINLAVNARDAMPDGGRLRIGTSYEQVDEAYARAHRPLPAGKWVVLEVADTGHGMTDEVKNRIFEPFFTTKEVGKGTGLGLSMVYGTVKQVGGYIFVDSAPNQGARFRMYFPPAAAEAVAAAPAPAVEEPPVDATAERRSETLLVVEDEPAVRSLVVTALGRDGYTVLQASTAAEARTVAAAHPHIDLLLSDANMPGGQSGIELANALVSERPDLLVVIMSGYTEEALSIKGLPEPITMLHKPFTPRELRRRIREILDAART